MTILFLCKVLSGCIKEYNEAAEQDRREKEESARRRSEEFNRWKYDVDPNYHAPGPKTELELKYYRQYQKKKENGL